MDLEITDAGSRRQAPRKTATRAPRKSRKTCRGSAATKGFRQVAVLRVVMRSRLAWRVSNHGWTRIDTDKCGSFVAGVRRPRRMQEVRRPTRPPTSPRKPWRRRTAFPMAADLKRRPRSSMRSRRDVEKSSQENRIPRCSRRQEVGCHAERRGPARRRKRRKRREPGIQETIFRCRIPSCRRRTQGSVRLHRGRRRFPVFATRALLRGDRPRGRRSWNNPSVAAAPRWLTCA